MAETVSAPNNQLVRFRAKGEREMPSVSKAQNAAMQAAAAGDSTLGIPQRVGREFTAAQKPGSVKWLPARVAKINKLRKRGLISDKAHGKNLAGKYGSNGEQEIDAASR